MRLELLLNQFENFLSASPRVPLTGKAIVDLEQAMRFLTELRLAIPGDVQEARQIQAEREEILAEAGEEAARLLDRSEQTAGRLVDESAILMEAQERADKLVAESEELAREIRTRAREYADEILEGLQGQLDRLAATVVQNREDLRR